MKGKISEGFFKAMAVVSALAIGGGFVSWRIVEARKAEQRESVERAKAEEEKEAQEMDMMVGSKSPGGRLVTREQVDEILRTRIDSPGKIPGIPEGAGEVTDIVPLLPGSKSIAMPLFTKREIKQLQIDDGEKEEEPTPPDSEEKLPDLLPGSKSSFVIPPAVEKPE